ncbi:hypothetical protein AB0N50_36640 [Streptomyces pharetrae]|jgi:hypothetical protein|uniref:hypothetical protein n=1 Tax=Streptomyces pharetrae TaxID=291370 RepID=UPI0034600DAE
MTTTSLYDLVTSEGDDGTMHPAEQLWAPGEDAVENGFIVHRGMHVTGIDDPTDDHLYPVGFVCLGKSARREGMYRTVLWTMRRSLSARRLR